MRELRNAVQRVLALGEGPPDATVPPGAEPSFSQARSQLLEEFEQESDSSTYSPESTSFLGKVKEFLGAKAE